MTPTVSWLSCDVLHWNQTAWSTAGDGWVLQYDHGYGSKKSNMGKDFYLLFIYFQITTGIKYTNNYDNIWYYKFHLMPCTPKPHKNSQGLWDNFLWDENLPFVNVAKFRTRTINSYKKQNNISRFFYSYILYISIDLGYHIGSKSYFHELLASYVKLRVAHAPRIPGTFSPPSRLSDPDMHHGACVTHVLWCMPGSLTSSFLWSQWRENVHTIPGACATRNFTYLVRGPCRDISMIFALCVSIPCLFSCGIDFVFRHWIRHRFYGVSVWFTKDVKNPSFTKMWIKS